MEEPIKILLVLTSGLKKDGITSIWLKYIETIKTNKDISGKIQFDFLEIDGLQNPEQVEKIKSLGCNLVTITSRKNLVKYFFSLVIILRRGKYDAVHANGSAAHLGIEMLAGWLAGTKIRASHSHNTKTNSMRMHKLFKPIFKLFCNTRFACGNDAGKWLYGEKDFIVLPNGLDFSQFQYDESERTTMRNKLGVEDKFVVGHVGRINEQKNHKYLIDVFDSLLKQKPNAILYIIGDGRLREQTEEYVKQLGINDKVVFTGEINNITDILQAMDIMLLPSLHEGLPNVVIEWQAMGLPVIVSDTVTKQCAVCNLVEFMSIKNNPTVWADRIVEISNSNKKKNKDAFVAKQKLRENGFNIKANAVRLVNVYKELKR